MASDPNLALLAIVLLLAVLALAVTLDWADRAEQRAAARPQPRRSELGNPLGWDAAQLRRHQAPRGGAGECEPAPERRP